ncbi:MAG TPA: hypothetical protein VMQ81_12355 [Acidimicrobiia bacterium]|nr:hypothetical protein [Acidimicrobiia bacterium]
MISTEQRAPATTATTTTIEPEARPDTRTWLAERISAEVGVMVAATWYVLFMIGTALEPRATGPDPTWAVALSFVFLAAIAVTAAGLLARRRWGLLASLGAAGIFTAFSVACPISGHHGFAGWWFGQMACAVALVGVSAFALARARA